MSTEVSPALTELLGRVFDDVAPEYMGKVREKMHRDFIFHMTDWLDDLERYAKLCRDPESSSYKEARDAVNRMLVHATHHLMAAEVILCGDLLDPFGAAKRVMSD